MIMKKTLSIIATVATFAGLGLASGTVAHAAVDSTGTGATTDANITLKTGDTCLLYTSPSPRD